LDLKLDPSLLTGQNPLRLYRLARSRFANLSGVGAALYPGRWNQAGEEAIYTSRDVGVPILERLVHTPKDTIPSNLAMMTINVSGDWFRSGSLVDRQTLASIEVCSSLAGARDVAGLHPHAFAKAVPSVIAPAWNIVLYPRRWGFWKHVTIESVVPFEFDPRLFLEQALKEIER
jgi:RES domain-containing protein